MAAANITLTYFDIRGLAELPRLLLAAAGAQYTDDRFTYVPQAEGGPGGEWPERKKKTPYGQVPMLTVDGVQIAQSGAIIRYLSKKFHLDGDDEIDCALVDAGFESVLDLRKAYFTNKSDAAKVADYWSKTFPDGLAHLSKNVKGGESATAAPWFNGKRMTYVDVAIYYNLIWVLSTENKDAVDRALSTNPKIAAIYAAVEKDERIAKYVAARKVTPM